MKKYEKNNKKNENKIKIKKIKKNISENIDPRGSRPVPFGSASQTATNSGGFSTSIFEFIST